MAVVSVAGCGVIGGAGAVAAGVERYEVPSLSMEPAIRQGETVTARKVKPGSYVPKAGDVVVFEMPPSWSDSPSAAGNGLKISRVIGLPGQRIACCDPQGRFQLDGRSLDEPYARRGAARPVSELTIPAGRLWVMGDNRSFSVDSRQQGGEDATVPVENVVGVISNR